MSAKFNAKLKYKSDKYLSKGMSSLITILVIVSIASLLLLGLILFLVAKNLNLPEQGSHAIWNVFIHMLDPGTVTGNSVESYPYITLLIIITFVGIIINSILIGTISNAIDDKLSTLRKGKSKVIESGHTVIIGLNDSAYTMISELIKANENQKRGVVVVLDDMDQEEMMDKISTRFPDTKNTEVICRSGAVTEFNVLDMCSITDANSVIINLGDDFETLKELMVISKFRKTVESCNENFHCVCVINDEENVGPAKIIAEDFADVVFFNESLARLIAHSCRYPGISSVYVDFFDLDGDEIYYEAFEKLEGMKFRDVIMSFKKSAVIGLVKDGQPILNPPMDTIYEYSKGDKVIHLAEDDNTSFPEDSIPTVGTALYENKEITKSVGEKQDLLILGENELMFPILVELDHFVAKGSRATLVGPELKFDKKDIPNFENIVFDSKEIDTYRYENLEKVVDSNYEACLILCDLDKDESEADSAILRNLVNLRYLAQQKGLNLNVISEMRLTENQKISSGGNVSDLVVGSNITSLMMTQLSENRMLLPLFEDLLDQDGSELYMKPVTDYINVENPINMYELQRILEKRGEIVIGYKIFSDASNFEIVSNPQKDVRVQFSDKDYLIVVSEG